MMTLTRRGTPFVFASVLVAAFGSAQNSAPVRWLPRDEITARLDGSKAWLPLVDTATLSLGRYRLAVGATDGQAPHARDEVYHVLHGRAKLDVGGEVREVAAGDSVFVLARTPHRFVEVLEDLDVLVFFSNATEPSGGMAAGPKPTEQTPYPETSTRGSARVFYWFGPNSAGQVAIDHGQPRWKAGFGKFLTEPSGARWRFGENFWTTLDTNMKLTFGDIEVPIGAHYAVLENHVEHGLRLVLLDSNEVRARRLDAYEAAESSGGIAIPLQLSATAIPAVRLRIEMEVDRSSRDHARLRIEFGPHALTTPFVMHPHRERNQSR